MMPNEYAKSIEGVELRVGDLVYCRAASFHGGLLVVERFYRGSATRALQVEASLVRPPDDDDYDDWNGTWLFYEEEISFIYRPEIMDYE